MRLSTFFLIVTFCTIVYSVVVAAEPDATEVLSHVFSPPPGTEYTAEAEMTQYLSGGKIRSSSFTVKRKTTDSSDRLVFLVQSPADHAGDVFLSVTNGRGAARSTKRWYFAARKKRVTEMDPKQSRDKFLDSDFSFLDLDQKYETLTDLQILGRPVIDGVNCWLVDAHELIKAKKTRHLRFWVRMEDSFFLRSALFDKNEQEIEQLKGGNIEKFGEKIFANKWEKRGKDKEKYSVINYKNVRMEEMKDDRVFRIETYAE